METRERAKDNQWWFSRSALRAQVENAKRIILSIDGRACVMHRAKQGSDGRPTLSFTFNATDLPFWASKNQTIVCLDLLAIDPTDAEIEAQLTTRKAMATPCDTPPTRAESFEPAGKPRGLTRQRQTLFDAYIFVDWSAANSEKSGKDSIWIAHGSYDHEGRFAREALANPRTRQEAHDYLSERLKKCIGEERRVLIGFDFPYGYPAGFHSFVLPPEDGTPRWLAMWNFLADWHGLDSPDNSNQRFALANELNRRFEEATGKRGPFWGLPNGMPPMNRLTCKRPSFPHDVLGEYRLVETTMKSGTNKAKRLNPKTVWQLYYQGCVGSQAILGIPRVAELLEKFRDSSVVWPFQTGWQCPERAPNSMVVHVEIYPGCLPVDPGLHDVPDAAQVLSCLYWAAINDIEGKLGQYFAPQQGIDFLRGDEARDVEGWIFGFRLPGGPA